MSYCLSHTEGVRAKKAYRCDLCSEIIMSGSLYDVRSGAADGGMYKMRMHPECHRYEQTPEMREKLHGFDWYEDISEPAFDRNEVHQHEESQLG